MRRGIGVFVLGAALLAAPVLANSNSPRVWGNGECHLDWCKPVTPPTTDLDNRLQQAADAARLADGRDCVPASEPRAGAVPAETVLTQPSGAVERVVWTYPAPAGSFVWSLCY